VHGVPFQSLTPDLLDLPLLGKPSSDTISLHLHTGIDQDGSADLAMDEVAPDPRPWLMNSRHRGRAGWAEAQWIKGWPDRLNPSCVPLATEFAAYDVNASNIMPVHEITYAYLARYWISGAGWLTQRFCSCVALDAVLMDVAGCRAVPPLPADTTAEARLCGITPYLAIVTHCHGPPRERA